MLLLLVVIFVPVAISYGQAHRLGVIWQARYILPMAVGVPLMAVALVERSDALRGVRTRVATLVCGLLAVAAFAAFAEALRRYAVGVGGPIIYLQGSWQPPFGATTLTIAAFVLLALMALYRPSPRHRPARLRRSGSTPQGRPRGGGRSGGCRAGGGKARAY